MYIFRITLNKCEDRCEYETTTTCTCNRPPVACVENTTRARARNTTQYVHTDGSDVVVSTGYRHYSARARLCDGGFPRGQADMVVRTPDKQ